MDSPHVDRVLGKVLVFLLVVALVGTLAPLPQVSGGYTSSQEVVGSQHDSNTELSNAEKLDNLYVQNGKVKLSEGSATHIDGFEESDNYAQDWTNYGSGSFLASGFEPFEGSYNAEYYPDGGGFDNIAVNDDFGTDGESGTMKMTGYLRANFYNTNYNPYTAFVFVDSSTGNYYRLSMKQEDTKGEGFAFHQSTDGGNTIDKVGFGDFGTYYKDYYIKVQMAYDYSSNKLTGRIYKIGEDQPFASDTVEPNDAINPDTFAVGARNDPGSGDVLSYFDDLKMESGNPDYATYQSQDHQIENPTNASVDITTLKSGSATAKVIDGNGNVMGSKTVSSTGRHYIDVDPSQQTDDTAKVRVEVDDSDNDGVLDFAMDSERVSFVNDPPTASLDSPTGGSTIYTNTPDLTASIDDQEFSQVQGDSLTVEWYLDGNKVAEKGPFTSAQQVSYEPASLSEGSHDWYVRVVDEYGGEVTTGAESFTVDHYAPQIDNSSASPSGGTQTPYSEETLQIGISDQDFSGDGDDLTVGWYIDGTLVHEDTGITSAGTVEYTTDPLAEGSHSWYVKVGDTWGDTVTSDTFNYEIKHVAPGIDSPSIDGVTRYENNELAVDVTDGDFDADGDSVDVGIYVDGAQVHTETITSNSRVSVDVGPYADGNYTWHAEAVDEYGYKTVSEDYILDIQHDKPEVSNPSLDGLTRYENNTLSVNVEDYDFAYDGDTVDVGFYVDGGLVNEQTISSNQTVKYDAGPYADGNYTWHVEAVDDYGYKTVSPDNVLNIQHFDPVADDSTANLKGGTVSHYEQNELSIDVGDGDFQYDGDTVDVGWYIDGNLVNVDEITQNQTVTYEHAPLEDGQHSWYVELIGDYDDSSTSSTFNFEIDHASPTFDNATMSPEGLLDTQKPTFKIDMEDGDFPVDEDTVDVGLYVNESTDSEPELEGVETLYENGTVDIEPATPVSGNSTYFFTAVDDYGYTQDSAKVDVEAPNSLFIHAESRPYDRVRDTVTVSVVTGTNETTDRSVTSDGTVEFGQLPAGEEYVFSLQAEGYYPRGVYVDDLYARSTIFLLNASETGYSTTLDFEDRSGEFQDNPIISIQTVINTSEVKPMKDRGPQWVTIGGDRLGVTGQYTTTLRDGGRYRFKVENQDGQVRTVGFYTAKEPATVDLEIGTVTYPEYEDTAYTWNAYLNETDTGGAATFAYKDPTRNTTRVDVTIKDRTTGAVLGQETYRGQSLEEVVYTLPINQSVYENTDLKVEWTAERAGGEVDGSTVLGTGPTVGGLPVDNMWLTVGFVGFVFIFAFSAGVWLGVPYVFMTLAAFSFVGTMIGIAPTALGGGVTVVMFALGAFMQRKKAQTVQPQ